MKLPHADELLELFEAEPAVLDPGVPWAYNTVTFATKRGHDEVRCAFDPGYGEIEFNWSIDGRSMIQLKVERVEIVRIERYTAWEGFVVSFSEQAALPDLIVQLKPLVKVQWGR
jgi:hypothetical protein